MPFELLSNYNEYDSYTVHTQAYIRDVFGHNFAASAATALSVQQNPDAGMPEVYGPKLRGILTVVLAAEYQHTTFIGPFYVHQYKLFELIKYKIDISDLLGRGANIQLPAKVAEVGITADLSPLELCQYAQVIFSQKMSSLTELSISSHPIDQPTFYTYSKFTDFHELFQKPEKSVLIDPVTGEEKSYPYLFVRSSYDSNFQGKPCYTNGKLKDSDLIRGSGITPRLRFQIQDQFLNIILRKLENLKEHDFFKDVTEEQIANYLTQISQSNAQIQSNYDSDHHQPNALGFYESYGDFIMAQNVPLTRLLYGHASWDVNGTILQTGFLDSIKHFVKLYSGYNHLSFYYNQWKKDISILKEEIDIYTYYQGQREARYHWSNIFSAISSALITFLGVMSYLLCISYPEFISVLYALPGATPYVATFAAIAFFLYDFDLGTNETPLTTSRLLFRSFMTAFKTGINIMISCLSILCSILFIPTRLLRSTLLYNLDSTWFRKFEADNDSHVFTNFVGNLFYFGGYLDIAITLAESVALFLLLQSSFTYLCIAFTAAEALTMGAMLINEWAPIIIAQAYHHKTVTVSYCTELTSSKLSSKDMLKPTNILRSMSEIFYSQLPNLSNLTFKL